MGDNRDTYYPMNGAQLKTGVICKWLPFLCNKGASYATLSDHPDDYMVVSGINHSKTNRAVYSSLTIIGVKKLMCVGGVNDVEFDGSAQVYMGNDDPIADYFYSYIFARNCTGRGKFCYEVVSEGEVSISLSDLIVFVERGYINPVTHIGGDRSEIIPP
jgi:hypothetical protein